MKVDRLFHRIHRQRVARRQLLIDTLGILVIGVLLGIAVWQQGWLSPVLSPSSDQSVLPPHVVEISPSEQTAAPVAPVVTETTLVPDYVLPVAEDGLAPVVWRIPTDLPIVYLTIDDGGTKVQQEIDLIKRHDLKVSLFLADSFIRSDPDFFKSFMTNGASIQNHSLNHDLKMSTQPYEYQKAEICGMADKIEQYYGKRPIFFRPPGGAYTDVTRKAAHDCGMKAVVTWVAKANGGSMQYQVGDGLRPGDIVLMHFRPEFQQDLEAFIAAMKAAGLQTEYLEDLKGASS